MATAISALSAPSEFVSATSRQRTQVHQLKQQGEIPSQIAASLGITTATVNNILGITTSNAGGVPSAALTPASFPGSSAGPVLSIFA
jgi:hypothetical protein